MKTILAVRRREYATVRQLEKNCYRLLKPLVVGMGTGILLTFTALFSAVGVAMCAVFGIMLLGLFIWMIRLQKEPRRDIRCPYCTNKNSVFTIVTEFECDICHRPISFTKEGVPVPADGSLSETKPTSVYDMP